MPQLDLRYSDDLHHIAFTSLFRQIEMAINEIDDSAGACKSRAYPAAHSLHTHVYLCMLLLKKEYRDAKFMRKCRDTIETCLKPVLPKNCFYSIELNFCGEYYLTSTT